MLRERSRSTLADLILYPAVQPKSRGGGASKEFWRSDTARLGVQPGTSQIERLSRLAGRCCRGQNQHFASEPNPAGDDEGRMDLGRRAGRIRRDEEKREEQEKRESQPGAGARQCGWWVDSWPGGAERAGTAAAAAGWCNKGMRARRVRESEGRATRSWARLGRCRGVQPDCKVSCKIEGGTAASRDPARRVCRTAVRRPPCVSRPLLSPQRWVFAGGLVSTAVAEVFAAAPHPSTSSVMSLPPAAHGQRDGNLPCPQSFRWLVTSGKRCWRDRNSRSTVPAPKAARVHSKRTLPRF
jgi:hypothetical protein